MNQEVLKTIRERGLLLEKEITNFSKIIHLLKEKAFLEKLKNLIGKSYTLGKDESLSASDSSDVIVVVGSKKAGN